jgi:hypothetical protein
MEYNFFQIFIFYASSPSLDSPLSMSDLGHSKFNPTMHTFSKSCHCPSTPQSASLSFNEEQATEASIERLALLPESLRLCEVKMLPYSIQCIAPPLVSSPQPPLKACFAS